jgi:hypothetical protein
MTTKTPRRTQHYDSVAPRFKNWETPPEFFKKLDEEFGFTLDAAASHENALCTEFCTQSGSWIHGQRGLFDLFWLEEVDGLSLSWDGYRVFLNPPYDSSIAKWVDKAFKFEAEVAVLLLPPSFDTAWGQRIWEAYHTIIEDEKWPWQGGINPNNSVEIRLPPGRLRFWRPAFKNPKSTLKDYEVYGEDIFDYSKPHVPGDAPRAGNLIAIFRR